MGSSYTNYEYHNLECQAGCDLTYFAQQMASTLAVFPKYQCLGPPSSPPSHNLCAASLVTEILHHHRGVQTGLMNMTPLLQSFCERPGGRCFKLTLKLDTSSCVVYCDSSTLPLRKQASINGMHARKHAVLCFSETSLIKMNIRILNNFHAT